MDRRKQIIKSRKFVRHKKKNWRKHCDVTDIEDWLDQKRKQEASGFKPASEKTNEELFHIDQDSSAPEVKRPAKTLRNLKSEYYSYPDTMVAPIMPVPSKKKRAESYRTTSHGHGGTVPMETAEKTVVDSSDDERQIVHSRRDKALAAVVRIRKFSRIKKQIQSERMIDIWGEEGNYNSNTMIKKPGSMKRKSCVPGADHAVFPHPGTSYNPSFTDHQRLLKQALRDESKIAKAEEKLNRSLNVPKMTASERESQWQVEMLEGLPSMKEPGEEQCDEVEDDLDTVITKRPIKASNRKTHQQRRKERIAKKMLRAKKLQYLQKIRMDEVYRIRSLKKEIKHKEENVNLLAQRKRQAKIKRELKRTKRLGKHSYEKQPIDFKLSDEMFGSLRLLQAEGNATRDQYYENILKRNKVAPKGPRNPKRYHKHRPSVRWVVSRAYDLRPDQLEIK